MLSKRLALGPTPIIIGHRGARALYPENTWEGIERVLETGIRALEFDIAISKDGVPVVHHDYRINPLICSGGTVPVSYSKRPRLCELTAQEIESFDCGSKNQWWRFPRQQTIPGARIPTLQKILRGINERFPDDKKDITLLIEAKVGDPQKAETAAPEVFVESIVKALKEEDFLGETTLQSFNIDFLRASKRLYPEMETALLWEHHWVPDPEQLRTLGVMAFVPHFKRIEKHDVDAMHDAGLAVVVWTANKTKDWEKLKVMGVDGIISDDPIALRYYLEKNAKDQVPAR